MEYSNFNKNKALQKNRKFPSPVKYHKKSNSFASKNTTKDDEPTYVPSDNNVREALNHEKNNLDYEDQIVENQILNFFGKLENCDQTINKLVIINQFLTEQLKKLDEKKLFIKKYVEINLNNKIQNRSTEFNNGNQNKQITFKSLKIDNQVPISQSCQLKDQMQFIEITNLKKLHVKSLIEFKHFIIFKHTQIIKQERTRFDKMQMNFKKALFKYKKQLEDEITKKKALIQEKTSSSILRDNHNKVIETLKQNYQKSINLLKTKLKNIQIKKKNDLIEEKTLLSNLDCSISILENKNSKVSFSIYDYTNEKSLSNDTIKNH